MRYDSSISPHSPAPRAIAVLTLPTRRRLARRRAGAARRGTSRASRAGPRASTTPPSARECESTRWNARSATVSPATRIRGNSAQSLAPAPPAASPRAAVRAASASGTSPARSVAPPCSFPRSRVRPAATHRAPPGSHRAPPSPPLAIRPSRSRTGPAVGRLSRQHGRAGRGGLTRGSRQGHCSAAEGAVMCPLTPQRSPADGVETRTG